MLFRKTCGKQNTYNFVVKKMKLSRGRHVSENQKIILININEWYVMIHKEKSHRNKIKKLQCNAFVRNEISVPIIDT